MKFCFAVGLIGLHMIIMWHLEVQEAISLKLRAFGMAYSSVYRLS